MQSLPRIVIRLCMLLGVAMMLQQVLDASLATRNYLENQIADLNLPGMSR